MSSLPKKKQSSVGNISSQIQLEEIEAINSDQEYEELLASVKPKTIETEEELESYLLSINNLVEKGEDISLAQAQLLDLLLGLVEDFEDRQCELATKNSWDVKEFRKRDKTAELVYRILEILEETGCLERGIQSPYGSFDAITECGAPILAFKPVAEHETVFLETAQFEMSGYFFSPTSSRKSGEKIFCWAAEKFLEDPESKHLISRLLQQKDKATIPFTLKQEASYRKQIKRLLFREDPKIRKKSKVLTNMVIYEIVKESINHGVDFIEANREYIDDCLADFGFLYLHIEQWLTDETIQEYRLLIEKRERSLIKKGWA